jgi:hypothetical protein
MVYMQETVPDWQPMYEPTPLAWEARLFVLYLLLVCGFLLLRGMSVIRTLWRTRKAGSNASSQSETKFLKEWSLCSIKVASIKRAAVLTFILSLLALLDGSIRVLTSVSNEKFTGSAVLAGATAEVLVLFALGVSVCAALYGAYSVLEGVLARRKATWDL